MSRVCRQLSIQALLFSALSPLVAATFAGRDPLPGRWEGAILVRPAELEVGLTLDFQRREGDLKGRISFPTQSAAVHDLAQVDAQGSIAQWIYKDPSGDPSFFNGVISSDGQELSGTVQDGGKTLRFTLQRAAEPAAPPRVTRLSPDGAELRSRFARDAGDVRLLMILSPTCTYCRGNARMVQSYVLSRIKDPHLKVYVVWEQINPGDTEAGSREVARLLSDARAAHFWADHRFTGNAFRDAVGAGAAPPWDIVLVFPPRERWVDRAPFPDLFMHTGQELTRSSPFNGERLAARVGGLLQARRTR